MRKILAALFLSLAAAGPAAAAADTAPAPKRKVIALISAVGDQLSIVRQRWQTGSNLEPYLRTTVDIPNDALNVSVLRGLDKVVAESDPDSERVFVKLRHEEMKGIAASDRERVAIGKLVKALEGYPARMGWDRIVVVTPTFVRSARQGMGSKLQGIGVYVQPLEGPRAGDFGGADMAMDTLGDEQTVTADGQASRSSVYVAPFFYTKVWVLDAKTLEVLETEGRYDYQKLYDPMWTAVDVGKNLTPAELSDRIVQFTERASARALRETLGVVTVTDPKPVAPAEPAKKGR